MTNGYHEGASLMFLVVRTSFFRFYVPLCIGPALLCFVVIIIVDKRRSVNTFFGFFLYFLYFSYLY